MNNDLYTILRILKDSGYDIINTDDAYIYMIDPVCPVNSFLDIIEYGWIILCCVTAVLLFGWAVTMIRGAKHSVFKNLRDLFLIFGTVSAIIPIVNMLWGDDIKTSVCETVKIEITELQQIQDMRNKVFEKQEYESIEIYDSGQNFDNANTNLQPVSISDYSETPFVSQQELLQLQSEIDAIPE